MCDTSFGAAKQCDGFSIRAQENWRIFICYKYRSGFAVWYVRRCFYRSPNELTRQKQWPLCLVNDIYWYYANRNYHLLTAISAHRASVRTMDLHTFIIFRFGSHCGMAINCLGGGLFKISSPSAKELCTLYSPCARPFLPLNLTNGSLLFKWPTKYGIILIIGEKCMAFNSVLIGTSKERATNVPVECKHLYIWTTLRPIINQFSCFAVPTETWAKWSQHKQYN